ncbi:hypothetical protein SOVF_188670, partial [Spinacia oleracea]
AEEDASDDEAAAINAPGGGMVSRDAPAFPGTGWIPSDLVFRPDWHLSQRPRAGMADEKSFRTYWSLVEVVWRPFANAVVPVSAARAHFLSWRRVLLPGVYRHMWYLGERVSLQHHSGDRLFPKDPLKSMLALDEDLARLYAEARGEAVYRSWREFIHRKGSYDDFMRRLAHQYASYCQRRRLILRTFLMLIGSSAMRTRTGKRWWRPFLGASPPHRKSYDVVPEHYAPERRRDRTDSVDREPQAETSLGQEGPSLELGQGSGVGAHRRHSDAERGASPF